jgi:hypothetical protein
MTKKEEQMKLYVLKIYGTRSSSEEQEASPGAWKSFMKT